MGFLDMAFFGRKTIIKVKSASEIYDDAKPSLWTRFVAWLLRRGEER